MQIIRDMIIGFSVTFVILFAATLKLQTSVTYEHYSVQLAPLNMLEVKAHGKRPLIYINDGDKYRVAEMVHNERTGNAVVTYEFIPTEIEEINSHGPSIGIRELSYHVEQKVLTSSIFKLAIMTLDTKKQLIYDKLKIRNEII